MHNNEHPLTAHRDAHKISLEALGRLLTPAANKSTISRWEAGEVLIPIDRLDNIEDVTGISRTHLRPDIFKGYAPAKEAAA